MSNLNHFYKAVSKILTYLIALDLQSVLEFTHNLYLKVSNLKNLQKPFKSFLIKVES